ncbi:MAG: hypothetical protein UR85_C0002G0079 [Candidatus Nomurabacteria bacterium GW2011_GWF2_35_66]|uniref:Uncharacterized protein n=1 Tax=Candidatus Nomurabacteria bacterium GW2011_GWE1_35_16 TaxID=1618761 RepID=A0A0G0BB54_9BACT|nr:MAG: hypothetical protein UR55_C0004G0039 [Candidatus Nomurabacteria bacterium GW2011_GWF1_34_20]KKP63478.1 MAG: hypothetical protein UR57_C0004G0039 [Candidatus Nomurabacteria bacterium GW2011_GWE2_34_25]KKP66658.1 MAG: hypothetical protein UR64_C0004G0039 [Candidatus Nomurabacteria bacterium GW2011_GWE1_35_16]KKP83766.1 MAG: hypothetical protein UR85_C0002G0079 [Candidatus Nomurabacteria bacterium GW2011_GWF2_35_66]HAE36457.1 hypothetical protein [Candidatus Nomurabacteria bacterium]
MNKKEKPIGIIKGNSFAEMGAELEKIKPLIEGESEITKNEETIPVKDKKKPETTTGKAEKKVKVTITGNKDKDLESYLERKEKERMAASLKITDTVVDTYLEKALEKTKNRQKGLEKKPKKIELKPKSREISEQEAIDIFKNNKIDEIIVRGGERKILNSERKLFTTDEEKKRLEERSGKIDTFSQDVDSKFANELLNKSKGGNLNEIYNDGAVATIINTKQRETEPAVKTKGVRVFLDVGGTWMKFEKDGETTTLRFDHHGSGKREPTSGSKMMYEFLKKAELIESTPELEKMVNFVVELDNLTYLDNKNEKGDKIFNEEYFENVWPNTLYAIAEKIPFKVLQDLILSGKIENPSIPFTKEQLEGELGQTEAGKFTIAELCMRAKEGDKSKGELNIDGAVKTIKGIKDSKRYAKQEKLNLRNTNIGNIVYYNYHGKVKTAGNTEFKVKIANNLGFIGTRATGCDSFVNWNQEVGEEKFFINSTSPNLRGVADRINEKYPGCAIEVRGTFLFGKIKDGITEAELLYFIDPKTIKGSNFKIKKEKVQVIKKNGTENPVELSDPNDVSEGEDSKDQISPENDTIELTAEEQRMIDELALAIESAKKRVAEYESDMALLKAELEEEEKAKGAIETSVPKTPEEEIDPESAIATLEKVIPKDDVELFKSFGSAGISGFIAEKNEEIKQFDNNTEVTDMLTRKHNHKIATQIIERYNIAKRDGSNPELVKNVEELLRDIK